MTRMDVAVVMGTSSVSYITNSVGGGHVTWMKTRKMKVFTFTKGKEHYKNRKKLLETNTYNITHVYWN